MYSKDRIYNEFVSSLRAKIQTENKKIIFLCIGTNNIVGDSFGPLVGSKLKILLENNSNVKVIGDMKRPINGKNIYKIIRLIDNNYKDNFIVSIDAAFSDFNMVGNIFVTDTGISFGSGINKNNIKVGNIGIKACIGNKGKNIHENIKILSRTQKELVKDLSQIVSLGIREVCNS